MSVPVRSIQRQPLVLRDEAPAADDFRADALCGLTGTPRTLPCKYLYDERGAELFERICTVPAYYPTRTELSILRADLDDMAARLGPGCRVVEFGSGSGFKTRMLLERLGDPVAYVPVDISRAQLVASAEALAERFPAIEVLPVCADYTREVTLPEPASPARRTVVFFPGSTIGNFEPAEAARFLTRAAWLAGRGGALLIGVDLKKDRATLERAYDDPDGLTAEFNLNLLHRLRRECGADVDPSGFAHRALWNEAESRIEMHLVSRRDQVVRLQDEAGREVPIRFGTEDTIVTEYSYKYTLEGFAKLAATAGWSVEAVWTDPARRFSVQLLRA